MGATTRITYGSSVQHALRDRNAGQPWRFPLPYAVQVVDEVEASDSNTSFTLSTRYRYNEGYHDGEEREYRGFAIVEQLDTTHLGAE